MILGSIRKTIRFLQICPIVITTATLIDIVLDLLGIVVTSFICTFFGTSLFITVGLYTISRSLYVSTWSKILYIALIVALLFDFLDQLFVFNITSIIFNELLLLILIVGILSSFITFIYDKFKYRL